MLRPILFLSRTAICDRNATLRKPYPLHNLFLRYFYLVSYPGSSDHSFPVGVLTRLYLFLHARSTETKQELIVIFEGRTGMYRCLGGRMRHLMSPS